MAKATLFRRTPSTIQIGLQCSMKAFPSDPGLAIGSTWRLSLVFRFAFLFLSMKCLPHVFASLNTLHRDSEYSALIGLEYYDSLESIMRSELLPPAKASVQDINQSMRAYQVNEPQARAILSVMRTQGFPLIQG